MVLELGLNGVSLPNAPIVELVARLARILRLPHNGVFGDKHVYFGTPLGKGSSSPISYWTIVGHCIPCCRYQSYVAFWTVPLFPGAISSSLLCRELCRWLRAHCLESRAGERIPDVP